MRFRVYSGPRGSEDVAPMTKDKLLFKEFVALDDALAWARHVEREGRVPLLIEGDDGTRMDRRSIVNALRVGMREQIGGVGNQLNAPLIRTSWRSVSTLRALARSDTPI